MLAICCNQINFYIEDSTLNLTQVLALMLPACLIKTKFILVHPMVKTSMLDMETPCFSLFLHAPNIFWILNFFPFTSVARWLPKWSNATFTKTIAQFQDIFWYLLLWATTTIFDIMDISPFSVFFPPTLGFCMPVFPFTFITVISCILLELFYSTHTQNVHTSLILSLALPCSHSRYFYLGNENYRLHIHDKLSLLCICLNMKILKPMSQAENSQLNWLCINCNYSNVP